MTANRTINRKNPPFRATFSPGRRLQRARQACRLTRKDVADRLGLSVQAVRYIDQGKIDKLAADERAIRRYLREYALLVNLPAAGFESAVNPPKLPPYRPAGMFILSHKSLALLVAVVTLAAVGFIGWRTFEAGAVPVLRVEQPVDGAVLNDPKVSVGGRTSEQAQVFINSINVPVGADGSYQAEVILQTGTNTIIVTSVNTFGRRAQATRVVYYGGRALD